MSLQVWLPLLGNTKDQGLLNLAMTGSPASYGTGPLGQSATFTGATANVIYNDSNLAVQHTDNFSWCTWIKTNFTGTTAQYAFTVGRADAGGLGYGLQCSSITNCIIRFGNKTYNLGVTGGEWTHIAFTKQGTSLKVYKNGALANTYTFDGALPTYSDGRGLGLGCFHYTGNIYPFYGSLCDFRIYDHVLSAKEVKEISKALAIHLPLSWGGNPNLIQGVHTRAVSGAGGTFTRELLSDDKGSYIRLTCTVAGYGPYWGGFSKTEADGTTRVGRKFTWSCTMRSSKATTRAAGHECGGLKDIALTTEWKNYSHTWTMTDGTYTAWRVYNNYAVGDWIELRDLKIEESDVATPWIPNTNDTAQYAIYNTKVCADDCSGYSRNATVTNCLPDASCPRYTTATKVSTTSDKIVLTSSLSSGQTLTEFTTAIWAKTNTINSTAPNIISLGQNSFWRFRIANATGTAVWYYIRVGATQVQSTYTTKALIDNIWHHYAITFKDGIVRFYIDGAQVGTTDHSATAKYITCASTNWLLHSYDGTSEAFVGSLSDCRIYHTCLSAEDVKKLYDTPIAIDNTGKLFCNNLVEE